MQAVLSGFEIVGVPFPSQQHELAASILSLPPENASDALTGDLNAGVFRAVEALWNEAATKEVVAKSFRFQLNDSATYFFDALARLGQADYLPTDQDILRTRVRSTGIVEETFIVNGTRLIVLDVGGQRSERKKWIHCFEGVQVLLFVAAISEYDQLWESISSSPWFRKTSLVLFLNKIDLFAQKIESGSEPLQKYLPEYNGDPLDADAAKAFMLNRFRAVFNHRERSLFCHFTCVRRPPSPSPFPLSSPDLSSRAFLTKALPQATDTTSTRVVLTAVMEAVLTSRLTQAGLL
ncbi:SPOSA6832_02536, partial [Sporobolomyces salmonicolor]